MGGTTGSGGLGGDSGEPHGIYGMNVVELTAGLYLLQTFL
jgi:hypothetical protein